ncbi:MAG: hypothetical protein IT455_20405 [Planctomycetes bacterium]|nr:hypothetical protein [Planctomycetota bacterium]
MTNLFRTLPVLSALAALALPTITPAQIYDGVGGRIEQQLNAIQRNIPLTQNGTTLVPWASTNRRIFVRFQADADRDVTGFQINMRVTFLPEIVPAWLYTADAQGNPSTVVASGYIGVGTGLRYCRASFGDAYRIEAGKQYFMAFKLTIGQDLRFGTASSGLNVTYFVTPTGAAQTAKIQYGVNTDGYSPKITMQQPYVGQSYNVTCTQASANQPGFLYWCPGGYGELDLHNSGAPGAFLWLDLPSAQLVAIAPASPGRTRQVTLAMPNIPGLVGLSFSMQWVIPTNSLPLGLTTSDYAFATVY